MYLDVNFRRLFVLTVLNVLVDGSMSEECESKRDAVIFAPSITPIANKTHDHLIFFQTQFPYEPVSFTYNPMDRTVFLVGNKSLNQIDSFDRRGNLVLSFKQKSELFEEIAVDPITENVYYIANQNVIGVCSLKASMCVRLIEPSPSLREPDRNEIFYLNLVLHPKRGVLFWMQRTGRRSLICQASMTGKQIECLNQFKQVKAFSLDDMHDKLYVVDDETEFTFELASRKKEKQHPSAIYSIFYSDCKLYSLFKNGHEVHSWNVGSINLSPIGHNSFSKLLMASAEMNVVIPVNHCAKFDCSGVCIVGYASMKKSEHGPGSFYDGMGVECHEQQSNSRVILLVVGLTSLVLTLLTLVIVAIKLEWFDKFGRGQRGYKYDVNGATVTFKRDDLNL